MILSRRFLQKLSQEQLRKQLAKERAQMSGGGYSATHGISPEEFIKHQQQGKSGESPAEGKGFWPEGSGPQANETESKNSEYTYAFTPPSRQDPMKDNHFNRWRKKPIQDKMQRLVMYCCWCGVVYGMGLIFLNYYSATVHHYTLREAQEKMNIRSEAFERSNKASG